MGCGCTACLPDVGKPLKPTRRRRRLARSLCRPGGGLAGPVTAQIWQSGYSGPARRSAGRFLGIRFQSLAGRLGLLDADGPGDLRRNDQPAQCCRTPGADPSAVGLARLATPGRHADSGRPPDPGNAPSLRRVCGLFLSRFARAESRPAAEVVLDLPGFEFHLGAVDGLCPAFRRTRSHAADDSSATGLAEAPPGVFETYL